MNLAILLAGLSVLSLLCAAYYAGCARGFVVAKTDRTPDGRFVAEQAWERRFVADTRGLQRRVAAATVAVVAVVLGGCASTGRVDRYPDVLGTVERTEHADGSISARYVPCSG